MEAALELARRGRPVISPIPAFHEQVPGPAAAVRAVQLPTAHSRPSCPLNTSPGQLEIFHALGCR